MKINAAVGRSYREAMQEFGGDGQLDVWYARVDIEEVLRDFSSRATGEQRKRLEKNLAKTRAKNSLKAFAKLTEVVDGEARIVSDPPLIVPIAELAGPEQAADVEDAFRDLIRQYRRTLSRDRRHLLERFRFVDAARKVVGVGSVGTRAWIVLMLGRDGQDPLFLQARRRSPRCSSRSSARASSPTTASGWSRASA